MVSANTDSVMCYSFDKYQVDTIESSAIPSMPAGGVPESVILSNSGKTIIRITKQSCRCVL